MDPDEEVTTSEDAAPDNADTDDKGADTSKTFTQDEVDRIIAKRLKRQENDFNKKYADYDAKSEAAEKWQKAQDEKATDSQRWEKEREALTTQLKERDEKLTRLERSNLIADLASEKGLPKSMWKRVQGDSEEDIAEDIEALVADLGGTAADKGNSKDNAGAGKKKPGALHGGGGEGEDPEPDIAEIVAGIPRGPQLRVDKPRTFR